VEAVSRSAELDDALLARNRELHAAQYHEQVKVTPQSTPLFALAEGVRVPIHRANGQFAVARERLSSAQLQRRIEVAPENFSANVLLRPVLQDYWLPTLATSAGRPKSPTSRKPAWFMKSCSADYAHSSAIECDADRAAHRAPAHQV